MNGVTLLVVGMTGDYLQPGRPGSETAREALPFCARAVALAREGGVDVVFAPRGYRRDGSNIEFMRRERFEKFRQAHGRWPMEEGSDGVAYPAELAPRADEPVVLRASFSAFFGTDLIARLRARAAERIVLVGANASMCVMATAFEALGHGLRVAVLEQALGDTSPESLAASRACFAKVIGLPAIDLDPDSWRRL